MNGKKIEITVPDGYDFVQDGLISKTVSADMVNIFNIFWIMSKLVFVDMADIFSLV
jgi:hypothetical protein